MRILGMGKLQTDSKILSEWLTEWWYIHWYKEVLMTAGLERRKCAHSRPWEFAERPISLRHAGKAGPASELGRVSRAKPLKPQKHINTWAAPTLSKPCTDQNDTVYCLWYMSPRPGLYFPRYSNKLISINRLSGFTLYLLGFLKSITTMV